MIITVLAMTSAYTKYYLLQGSGLQHIGPLHHQPRFIQKGSGAGLGGLFSKIYKYFTPIAKTGLSALKEQVLRSGKNIIKDLEENKPIDEVLADRGVEALSELTRKGVNKLKRKYTKQNGSGYIKRKKLMNIITPLTINKQRRIRKPKRSKNKKRRTKQIGGRRRRINKKKKSSKKKRKNKRSRTLDIFN